MKITWTRIALLILAVPFAWRWGPAFLDWLVGVAPSLGNAILFLTPDISGQSAGQWLKFLVAAIIFFLLFQLVRLMFGFAAPQAQRFGTTKSLRRVQGLIAEAAVIAFFIAASLQVAVWRSGAGEANLPKPQAVKMAEPSGPPPEEQARARREARASLANERARLESASFSFYEDLHKYKQKLREEMKIPAPADPSEDARFTGTEFDDLWKEKTTYGLAGASFYKTDLERFKERYAALKAEERRIAQLEARGREPEPVNSPPRPAPPGRPDEEGTSQLAHYAQVFGQSWFSISSFALLAYFILGYALKEIISDGFSAVMRFLHKGRFGMGGSARFIGLVEEWSVRWKPRRALLPWFFDFFDFLKARVPLDEKADAAILEKRAKKQGGFWERAKPRSAVVREALTAEREYTGGGDLFMGRSLYNRSLHLGLKDDRHMMTIGGTRAGKGATAIIPNLLTFDGSILCIDPKGENARITARRRKEMGQAVHIVDPFHLVTEDSARFNPLEHLDASSPRIREAIGTISDSLVVHDSANKMMGSHWEDGARSVLSGFIAQLVTDGRYRHNGPPNLPMIRDLLALKTNERAALLTDMSNNRGAGDAARDIGARLIRGIETEEITNIMSNADKHSEWLSFPSMRAILTNSTFKFSDLKETPTTIYLVIPPELLELHKRFLRLFINLALGQMPIGGRAKVPVLMILDEFLQLGKMPTIERAFRLLAGYNFVVWPFAQELAGLKEMYGEGVNSFLTNSRAVQVFGVNDAVTLDYISKQIGQRSMQYVSGMADNQVKTTLLRTPDEVGIELARDGGMQYLLRAGKPPMALERVNYYEDRQSWLGFLAHSDWAILRWVGKKLFPFAGLYDPNPDYQ